MFKQEVTVDPVLKAKVEDRIKQARYMSTTFGLFDKYRSENSLLNTVLSYLDIQYSESVEEKEWSDPDTGSTSWEVTIRKIKVHHQGVLVYHFDGSNVYWGSTDGKVEVFRPDLGSWMETYSYAKGLALAQLGKEKSDLEEDENKRKDHEQKLVENDLKNRYGL